MSNEESNHRRFDVFTIREYEYQKQIKSQWSKLGVAFENSDGSWNLRLHALPLPDPKTGLAHLHMRPPRPREQDSQDMPEEMPHFNYRPFEPADAADLI